MVAGGSRPNSPFVLRDAASLSRRNAARLRQAGHAHDALAAQSTGQALQAAPTVRRSPGEHTLTRTSSRLNVRIHAITVT